MLRTIASLLPLAILDKIYDTAHDELVMRGEIIELDSGMDDFDRLSTIDVHEIGQKAFANLQKRGAISTWIVAHYPNNGLRSNDPEINR